MYHSRSVQILEELAASTWNQIKASESLGLPYAEETITEVNNLSMRAARIPELLVAPVSKRKEAIFGLDWTWFIGSDKKGWWQYAVQAKRIDSSRKYPQIRYKVRGRLQSSILREYALDHRAIPLYCLYNFEPSLSHGDCWNCRQPFDEEQLGCTLLPLDVAVTFSKKGARSTFRQIHSNEAAIPWRCILKCPGLNPADHNYPHPLASKGFFHVRRSESLPPEIDRLRSRLSLSDEVASAPAFSESEIVPRHVIVIDTGEER